VRDVLGTEPSSSLLGYSPRLLPCVGFLADSIEHPSNPRMPVPAASSARLKFSTGLGDIRMLVALQSVSAGTRIAFHLVDPEFELQL
jgi:hypothetical protein